VIADEAHERLDGPRLAEELRRRAPATVGQLTELRNLLAAWAARTGLTREATTDVVLATYEAMTNVLQHAYPPGAPGAVVLRAIHRADGGVTVVVSDEGRWRTPVSDPAPRGWGLRLIRSVVATEVVHGPAGTTVTMRWPSRSASAAPGP
jgi:serine/threonine-protein kinase RsbW